MIKRILILSILLFIGLNASAQEMIVKGRIFDIEQHEPLSGVIVQEFSTKKQVVSNENGDFEIGVSTEKGELILSSVGYKSQTIQYDVAIPLTILLEVDALLINDVKITAFSGDKSNKETAGAITVISGDDIRRGSGVSMQSALNSVPGVRMDQSSLSDSRISIRGNGVRSPWGIRNVRIYLNDIPLTEVDGTSRIEGIDVNDLGQVEIIRGPASSIYGSGTAGVMKFNLERAPYQEQSIQASGLVGSYGLARMAYTYRGGGNKMNSYVSYGMQEYQGYRDHSADKRNFITANFQFFPTEKQMITVLVNRTSQKSQIPGALTQAQMEGNPRQAAPSNLDKNARRDQNWTRIGLSQRYKLNNQFSNTTSIYTYFYDLEHPLPYAFLRNFYQSFGGRTKFEYDPNFKILKTKFIVGGEFNQANTKGTQYVNNKGVEGAMMSNVDYKNSSYLLFLQAETQITKRLSLVAGMSYNGLSYNVSDYLKPSKSGIKKFKPQATPRVTLSYNFGSFLSLHASVSTGFSAPTGSEIQNIDGSINPNLQSQTAVNYEVDAKGNFLKGRLAYSLALFKMDMRNELIGQTTQQGITVYHNSGRTDHTGAELALSWIPIKKDDNKAITLLQTSLSMSYSYFTFVDYRIKNANDIVIADYRGNQLTGVSPWNVSSNVSIHSRIGIYGEVIYYFNDKLPLDDMNTTFNKAWSTLNAKIGYRQEFWKCLTVDVYGGIDNITNTKYSSLVALNAVGYGGSQPAYFNPSPARNFYVGMSLKYSFKSKTSKNEKDK